MYDTGYENLAGEPKRKRIYDWRRRRYITVTTINIGRSYEPLLAQTCRKLGVPMSVREEVKQIGRPRT